MESLITGIFMLDDLTASINQESRGADLRQIVQTKLARFNLPSPLRDATIKIALVQNREKPFLAEPMIYTFFGDHGIDEAGLCKKPAGPRGEIVRQYISGQSALNIFCRQNRIELRLVDCGLAFDVDEPRLIQRKINKGTRNFAEDQAMSTLQLERCLKNGRDLIRSRRNQASNTVGIGIQSQAAELSCIMLVARLSSQPLESLLQRHPAFDAHEIRWILKKLRPLLDSTPGEKNPLIELQNFAGFEIVTALGTILQACQQRCIVLVDGFVGTCLAWLVSLLVPAFSSHIIIAQESRSDAEAYLAAMLRTEALASFDTCIADGSGIAITFPMLQAACTFLNESSRTPA